METIFSERGDPLKVLGGYKYRKHREFSYGVVWRCTVQGCARRIHTDSSGNNLLTGASTSTNNHNHQQASDLIQK